MSAARDEKTAGIELPNVNATATASASAIAITVAPPATTSYRDEKARSLVKPIASLGLPNNSQLTYLHNISPHIAYEKPKGILADGSTLSIGVPYGDYHGENCFLIRHTDHEHIMIPAPFSINADCKLTVLSQSSYAIVSQEDKSRRIVAFILDINSMQFVTRLKEQLFDISDEKKLENLSRFKGFAVIDSIIPLSNGKEIIIVVNLPNPDRRNVSAYQLWNLTNPLKPICEHLFATARPIRNFVCTASDGNFIFYIVKNERNTDLIITQIELVAGKEPQSITHSLGDISVFNIKIIDNFLILITSSLNYPAEFRILDISDAKVPVLLETIALPDKIPHEPCFDEDGNLLITPKIKKSIQTLHNHFLLRKNVPNCLAEHLRYANGQPSPSDVRHLVYQYLFDKPLLLDKFKTFLPKSYTSMLYPANLKAESADGTITRKFKHYTSWKPLIPSDTVITSVDSKDQKEPFQIIAAPETITATINLITYIKASMSKMVPDSDEMRPPNNKKAILAALEKTLQDHTEKSTPLAQKKLADMLMETIRTATRHRNLDRKIFNQKTASGKAIFNLLSKKERPDKIISPEEIDILRQLLFLYFQLSFDSYDLFTFTSYAALEIPEVRELNHQLELFLVNTDADAKQPQDNKAIELIKAINNRDYDKITWLMQRGTNPNALTPIHMRIEDFPPIMDEKFQKDAQYRILLFRKMTPLAFAIMYAEIFTIQTLLKYDPNIFKKNHETSFIEFFLMGRRAQKINSNYSFAKAYRFLRSHNAFNPEKITAEFKELWGNFVENYITTHEKIADAKSIEAVRKLARFAKSKTSFLRNMSCLQDAEQDKNAIFTRMDNELKQELGKNPLTLREEDLANGVLKIIQNAMRVRLGVTNQRTDSAEAIINLLSGKTQSNDIAPAEVGIIKNLLEIHYLITRTSNYDALKESIEAELTEMQPLVFGKIAP